MIDLERRETKMAKAKTPPQTDDGTIARDKAQHQRPHHQLVK